MQIANMPKNFLFIFLVAFLIFIIPALYFVDKDYFVCPIEYEDDIIIRNDEMGKGVFGAPRSGGRRHKGIDLYAQVGTEIKAVRFAQVKEVGFHNKLGNFIYLRHPGNLITVYGHLQRFLVKAGQLVTQGEIIGYVGKTGNAKHPKILPHVHFEIRIDNTPVDPLEWLKER
jgi:murein DD-endopeptidase MepM/ murein hydrolase activator NlpD